MRGRFGANLPGDLCSDVMLHASVGNGPLSEEKSIVGAELSARGTRE